MQCKEVAGHCPSLLSVRVTSVLVVEYVAAGAPLLLLALCSQFKDPKRIASMFMLGDVEGDSFHGTRESYSYLSVVE